MLRTVLPKFWTVRTNEEGTPEIQRLPAHSEKGGTTLKLTLGDAEAVEILGRVDPIGVSRPKVFLWPADRYEESLRLFERGGGALLGAFLMLAVFSAFVGASNRDWSFLLFSGWLITSLRVAAVNDGWDLAWLQVSLDQEFNLLFLKVTLAAHALLTVALFRSLLSTELQTLRLDGLFKSAVMVSCGQLIAASQLSHKHFLPVVWGTTALGIVLILVSLGLIVHRARSTISLWYAGSWGATFTGILTEVGYASGLLAVPIPGLNSQTASVASALILTWQLNSKHARIHA